MAGEDQEGPSPGLDYAHCLEKFAPRVYAVTGPVLNPVGMGPMPGTRKGWTTTEWAPYSRNSSASRGVDVYGEGGEHVFQGDGPVWPGFSSSG